jgi:hypothetical protein
VSGDGLTPDQRAALAGRLLVEMCTVLPPESAQLSSTRSEIAAREQAGQEVAVRLRSLLDGGGAGGG